MDFTDITAAQLRDRPDPHPAVSSQIAFHGAIWDVQRERFHLGEQDEALTREFIDHPGAVAILALDEQDRVLLINQYRHPVGLRMWEIPAGLLDEAGEAPHAAAQRELGEEADLRAERWHTLVDFHNSPGSSTEGNRVFLARGLQPVPEGQRHERSGEESEIVAGFVPLDAAVDAVLAGRLHSPTAVFGIMAAHIARARDWEPLRPVDAPWQSAPRER